MRGILFFQVVACSRAEQLAWNSNIAAYLLSSGISQPTSLQVLQVHKLVKPSCFCAQAHVWPAVTALRSVVVIGSRGQGKTVNGISYDDMSLHFLPSGWMALAIALSVM